jgi:hypothetical protein
MSSSLRNLQFSSKPLTNDRYDFQRSASLGGVAGTWSAISLLYKQGQMNITTSGAITAEMTGCKLQGQMNPSPQGKNIFVINLTTETEMCFDPMVKYEGLAVQYKEASGSSMLIFATDVKTGKKMVWMANR